MKERVPIVLLTGFLGAGKTTLLRRWLTDSPSTGRKLGIVMNEFGPVGVDTLLVSKPDLPVQEVAGGCLCCASDTDLTRGIGRLVRENGCDLIVVEPSGLADPLGILDLLTDPDVLERYELRAVVAVLDARAYGEADGEGQHWPLLRDQMRFADWHLLAKCDVAPDDVVGRLEQTARSLNPGARTRRLPYHPPSLTELLDGEPPSRELPNASGSDPDRGSGEHAHRAYRSVIYRFPLAVGRSAFEEFLRELDRREVVRAKGFVRFSGQPDKVFLFQMVGGHFLIDEFPAHPLPEPVAVLIGPSLDAARYTARLQRLVWGRSRG